MTYLIYFKNDDCACQKSFAMHRDGVSFQIILACFALTAILGIMQHKFKLEDLKVLRRSPDLLNNVKIGQGQLQLIMEQILFFTRYILVK